MIEPTTQAVLLGQVRALLATVGGALVTKGMISAGTLELVLGIVMAAIPFLWSAWGKYNDERKALAREAIAVNVGIAVADNTIGPTPLVTAADAQKVIKEIAPTLPAGPVEIEAPPEPLTTEPKP